MKRKTVLVSLAALGLLFSGLVGCNNKPAESSKPASTPASNPASQQPSTPASQPASQPASTPASQPASSTAPAHVHEYGDASVTVKNADGKDVFIKECKDKDDKYIGIAFDDYSEKSAEFGDTSGYSRVPEELRNESHLLAKSSTISWKVNVDKAIEGAKLAFGMVYTGSDHGSQTFEGKYTAKVNDGADAAWDLDSSLTYDEAGLSQTARGYVVVQTINLVAGENTITLGQGNGGYRLLFGGEVRIHYSGDATITGSTPAPVEEGYEITFTHQHCKIFVYESGQDYSIDPVETDKTLSRDDNGAVCKYVAPDAEQGIVEVKPQVNFKVVCDEGYAVDGECISISGTQGVEWNKLASQGQDIYRITKIKADITVNVTAKVKSAEEAPGYEATFQLSHCTVKVYLGKKNAEGDNIDTAEKYYTRDKDSGEYSKDGGQINFEVFPETGYEFNSGLALGSSTSPAGVSFITNGTGGAANFSNLKVDGTNANLFSITKVSSNLIITITCTLVA